MKVLIVEDEVRISHLLKMYFERESFQTNVANNGVDGLEKALQDNYDLIILDIFMPGKDGFTVLEELRKQKNTPVILLSAQNGENDINRGIYLGADVFVSKPFSPASVVLKAKELMPQCKEQSI